MEGSLLDCGSFGCTGLTLGGSGGKGYRACGHRPRTGSWQDRVFGAGTSTVPGGRVGMRPTDVCVLGHQTVPSASTVFKCRFLLSKKDLDP